MSLITQEQIAAALNHEAELPGLTHEKLQSLLLTYILQMTADIRDILVSKTKKK